MSEFLPDSSALGTAVGLTTRQLETELLGLAGHIAAAQCRFLQLLAEFDRRGAWAGPGLKSCAHWLCWRIGMSLRTAAEHVRVSHALVELPKITEALAAGRISYSKVRAITRIAGRPGAETAPDTARPDDADLVLPTTTDGDAADPQADTSTPTVDSTEGATAPAQVPFSRPTPSRPSSTWRSPAPPATSKRSCGRPAAGSPTRAAPPLGALCPGTGPRTAPSSCKVGSPRRTARSWSRRSRRSSSTAGRSPIPSPRRRPTCTSALARTLPAG